MGIETAVIAIATAAAGTKAVAGYKAGSAAKKQAKSIFGLPGGVHRAGI